MKHISFRVILVLLSVGILSACVPEDNGYYFENTRTERCEGGAQNFALNISVPREYGRIHAMTQHANTSQGLVSVCPLNVGDGGSNHYYYGYSAEAYDGNAGICVSARTSNAGHVMSCVSRADVRRAMASDRAAHAYTLQFTQWSPYNND